MANTNSVMTTNHFTIELSRALQSLGIEWETEAYWAHVKHEGKEYDAVFRGYIRPGEPMEYIGPAYQLHDILRLMPRIGEKMGWEYKENGGGKMKIGAKDPQERKEIAREWGIKSDTTVYSEKFLKAFIQGDYPKAEQYLLTILKQ